MRTLGLAVGVGLMLALGAPDGGAQSPAADAAVLEMATADTITVAPNVLQGLAKTQPDIVAPEGAPQTGAVSLQVLVSQTGEVEEVAVLSGDDTLGRTAVDGVEGWTYTPFMRDGEPREIQSTILLNFHDGVGKPEKLAIAGFSGGGRAVKA